MVYEPEAEASNLKWVVRFVDQYPVKGHAIISRLPCIRPRRLAWKPSALPRMCQLRNWESAGVIFR